MKYVNKTFENRLCCRFFVVWHLSKFRENIKYFRKCNVDVLSLVPLVKTEYIFKSIVLCFFFIYFI